MIFLIVIGGKIKKAWMLNSDYSKKEAYYSVLKALYETGEKKE